MQPLVARTKGLLHQRNWVTYMLPHWGISQCPGLLVDQILKPVDAKSHQVQVWWYVRNAGKPAEEYFNNELEDADRARISRTFEAIRKGQKVPETLFKGRGGSQNSSSSNLGSIDFSRST